jgi:uncharacterized membrane protein
MIQNIKAITQTTKPKVRADDNSIIAIYDTHTAAESAIKSLQQAGIDMKQLSIVGKDFYTEEHVVGFYTSGERMKFAGGRGAFWGSLWGVLFGSAFFVIPIIGPLVGMIVSALSGAVIGGSAGVLAAALASLGIPEDSVVKYELAVKGGSYLVLARGSSKMVELARTTLGTSDASHLQVHAA